jgi:hypothetical protein
MRLQRARAATPAASVLLDWTLKKMRHVWRSVARKTGNLVRTRRRGRTRIECTNSLGLNSRSQVRPASTLFRVRKMRPARPLAGTARAVIPAHAVGTRSLARLSERVAALAHRFVQHSEMSVAFRSSGRRQSPTLSGLASPGVVSRVGTHAQARRSKLELRQQKTRRTRAGSYRRQSGQRRHGGCSTFTRV